MIVCICKYLDEKKIQELKEKYPNTYMAQLAKTLGGKCGTCIKYLKKQEKDAIIKE